MIRESSSARVLLAGLLLFAASAVRADRPVQRYLESLKLGDTLAQIQQVYPPKSDWSRYREPGGKLTRVVVERGQARYYPLDVQSLSLGMRRDKLVAISIVYDRDYTKKKPLGELVFDLSLVYGEPRRWDETYFWDDGDTVLAVSNARLPAGAEGRIELRTSLELMERKLFPPFR